MAIFNLPIARVGDDNFRVGSGYRLYFYEAGTLIAKDTFTDNTYATPLANPVVADGNGRFPVIWTTGEYKVILKTDEDVTVWMVDDYSNDTASNKFAEGVLSAAGSAPNVITANLPTTPGSLIDQLQVVVELQHGANTAAAVTFNLNSLGAKTVKRDNNQPLIIGDTGGSGYKIYLSYSAANDVWVLLNPKNSYSYNGDLIASGSATFTNSTNNIALTGIGSTTAITLEVGDAINVSGTTSNNGDYTVEVITDGNNVIVNQAHAGGTTSKSLTDETAASTVVKLKAKNFVAPLGLGQGWVGVSRSNGVEYTNSTGRTITVSFSAGNTGATSSADLTVDGILLAENSVGPIASTSVRCSAYGEVPPGSTYEPNWTGTVGSEIFNELR